MSRKAWYLIFVRLSLALSLLFLVAGQPALGTAGAFEVAVTSPKAPVATSIFPDQPAAAGPLYAMAVAVSGDHACALVAGGGLKCWGHNQHGELGDGTTTDRNTPVDVVGLEQGVIAVAPGHDHTCALVAGGGVKCWGDNEYGQLGDGTNDASNTPVDVAGLSGGATAVAAGGTHTCALVSGGGIKCWGKNDYGQLGDGTITPSYTPVDVVGLNSGVTAVTAGVFHTCAIVSGGVKCWGNNFHGELGDGTTNTSSSPVDVNGLGQGVTAIAAGSDYTCALVSGGIKCWGLNDNGQLGDGTNTNRLTPVDVTGLEQEVTAVAAGFRHTCALGSGGGAKCWGENWYGQLGDGTMTNSSTPVDVFGLSQGVTAIAPGFEHTCAIYSGAVMCWGSLENGALGDGTVTQRSIPFDVTGLEQGVNAITIGYEHTCVLVSGGVKCWGDNYYGQLGDGTTIASSTPVEVIGLDQGVTAITTDYNHNCALVSGGGVKCWGENWYGQLGDGTTTDSGTPVDVVGLSSGVTAIAAGFHFTCAIVSGGGAKCWGVNYDGQLGDGTTTNSSTPVDVVGLSSGVTGITAGEIHTCALVSGGGVKCWGVNDGGQLGDGTNNQSSTPVDVVGLSSGVTSISAGDYHSCAIVSGGGVKCWGGNPYGELGDGTTDNSSTPVDVTGLSSGVTGITAGDFHTCAIGPSGGLKCWGKNEYGQLGDGTTTNRSTPVDVAGLSQGVTAVAAGYAHTCALVSSAGRAKCWGLFSYERFGIIYQQRLTPGYVVESAHPILTINYPTGQPGSLFTLTGWNFPLEAQGSLSINGQVITTTLVVNPTGSFIFFLDTTGAEEGGYAVTVSVILGDSLLYQDASAALLASYAASTCFFLFDNAPLRPQEGGGLVYAVPVGIALHNFVYLPILRR
jgi:alpha-tubulin suppressor-like RCC1 family protein